MKSPELWGALRQRYEKRQPRKMLALDGGGIRGVLTLGILKRIEDAVGPLHEFFDYIAGTSTGAIIAAGLSLGMSVDELIDFYKQSGPAMFQRTHFLKRFRTLYENGALEQQLKTTFGENTTLQCGLSPGTSHHALKTLLLVVTRNITTDSPWPISNNPEARYNAAARADCNARIPLWRLVRASTAAPIFFPPEVISWDPDDPSKSFVFVDGGVTPYNNPAFLLYRFATDPAYRLEWPRGEDQLLLVSVGTGAAPIAGATADDPDGNMLSTGIGIPSALMYGSLVDQDINCRAVGRCTYGDVIDRELLDMVPRLGPDTGTVAERLARAAVPLTTNLGRAFLYARYNVDLGAPGLRALGFTGVDPASVQKMDNATPDNIDRLLEIGGRAAHQVDKAHFGGFA
jgi:hypothetical protein